MKKLKITDSTGREHFGRLAEGNTLKNLVHELLQAEFSYLGNGLCLATRHIVSIELVEDEVHKV